MTTKKLPQASSKRAVSIVRSSAAEYLTFVAASGQGGVEAVYADESIWVTQKMMGTLPGTGRRGRSARGLLEKPRPTVLATDLAKIPRFGHPTNRRVFDSYGDCRPR